MDSGTERKQTDDYFSWEASYAKIWSVILDDSSDSIQGSINKFNALQQKRLTRNLALIPGLKKGLIRNFIIVIEASKVAEETDLFPTRLKWILNRTCKFAKDYLEQNPLCQLGVVITRGGIAEKLIDLTNDYSALESVLSKSMEGHGDASFKNALDLSMSLFGNMPSHASREILVLQCGLSSCDAGDIRETCARLKEHKIKVSVISFLGQVYFSEMIAKTTGGNFEVVLNEDHFVHLFMQYVQPPSVLAGDQKTLGHLVQMGFPQIHSGQREFICLCHNRVVQGGFSCPRCDCQVCSIPSDCPVCQLTLISSSHLARSYHHLFPVAPFESVAPADCTVPVCFGCGVNLIGESAETLKFKCESCGHVFCVSCDAYIHASLHNCPGCLFKPCK